MNLILLILFLLLLALTLALWWQVRRQHYQLLAAKEQLAALAGNAGDNREPEMVITLKVTDPIRLAKRESRSARLLADRLPVMVRKMVYQQVIKELEEELRERQIEADMAIEYR